MAVAAVRVCCSGAGFALAGALLPLPRLLAIALLLLAPLLLLNTTCSSLLACLLTGCLTLLRASRLLLLLLPLLVGLLLASFGWPLCAGLADSCQCCCGHSCGLFICLSLDIATSWAMRICYTPTGGHLRRNQSKVVAKPGAGLRDLTDSGKTRYHQV